MKYLRYVGRGKKCTPLFLFGGEMRKNATRLSKSTFTNRSLELSFSLSLLSLIPTNAMKAFPLLLGLMSQFSLHVLTWQK
jgi:hypothetical protein